MGSKLYFSQLKSYFSQFIDKLLKFEEMEYLINNVKVEIWPALCKFPILFSTVKLNLDITFPNSSIDSKLGLWNLGFRLYFQVFPK